MIVWCRGTGAPRTVPSSLNCTVPEVSGVPAEVTVAVNVTVWPNVDGFESAVTAVPVLSGFTTCASSGETDAE